MNVNNLAFMAAASGTITVNDTSEKTVNFNGLYVSEDAVISSLKVNGTDVKSSYVTTPGTAVKAGTIITCQSDLGFSGITLTSGQVTLILA